MNKCACGLEITIEDKHITVVDHYIKEGRKVHLVHNYSCLKLYAEKKRRESD